MDAAGAIVLIKKDIRSDVMVLFEWSYSGVESRLTVLFWVRRWLKSDMCKNKNIKKKQVE